MNIAIGNDDSYLKGRLRRNDSTAHNTQKLSDLQLLDEFIKQLVTHELFRALSNAFAVAVCTDLCMKNLQLENSYKQRANAYMQTLPLELESFSSSTPLAFCSAWVACSLSKPSTDPHRPIYATDPLSQPTVRLPGPLSQPTGLSQALPHKLSLQYTHFQVLSACFYSRPKWLMQKPWHCDLHHNCLDPNSKLLT